MSIKTIAASPGEICEHIELTPEEEAEWAIECDINILNDLRSSLMSKTETEGVSRISAQVPEWDDLDTIKFIVSISNLLVMGNITPQQDIAKQIYLYAKSQINWIKTATLIELQDYDPSTDINWPI